MGTCYSIDGNVETKTMVLISTFVSVKNENIHCTNARFV
jgi:hypothetical protein